MKHLFRTAAVSALVAVFALALPTAAHATIYPPSGSCTVSPTTTAAGGTVTFQCAAETFSGTEPVTITITGEDGGDASIGMVAFAITTASGTAASNEAGALDGVPITLPSNATGTYNIAAVSATSPGRTAAVTVTADGGLPATGMDSASLLGLWIGGGALVLAGVALAVVAAVRRHARRTD